MPQTAGSKYTQYLFGLQSGKILCGLTKLRRGQSDEGRPLHFATIFFAPGAMKTYDIHRSPGHLIRRAQQIVASLFASQTKNQVTPIQYALLAVLAESDGLDQITLAGRVALDASTSGNTLERMAQKGWVERLVDPLDRRRRVLKLTRSGRSLFEKLIGNVVAVQTLLLDPLDPEERALFVRLLSKLVHENNAVSRVPLRLEGGEDGRAAATGGSM